MTTYSYQHTQAGTLMRIIFGCILAIDLCLLVGMILAQKMDVVPGLAGVSVVFVLVLLLFHSLTVRVSDDWVQLRFGIGWIGKKFAVWDIESVTATQTRWYNGWGIKKIMGGWLFNISGFDVVELKLRNGRRYMIGTDEPQRLCQAIEGAVAQGKP
jgi:hypothetical protein